MGRSEPARPGPSTEPHELDDSFPAAATGSRGEGFVAFSGGMRRLAEEARAEDDVTAAQRSDHVPVAELNQLD